MFGLFKTQAFTDPVLGTLVRSRGLWRCELQLDSGSTKLALSGSRTAPDAEALFSAHHLKAQMVSWQPAIECALFEHYEPYAQASVAGESPVATDQFPNLTSSADVWKNISLTYVAIAPLSGVLTTELGYITEWDEEHTVGIRFVGDLLVELCGSVLPP